MALSPKLKKALEWILPLLLVGILFYSGLWPEISGALQGLVVKSGMVNPSTETREDLGFVSTEFTLDNGDGQIISSTELAGKTVFVNLWATWCPPCIAELPDIEAMYQEMRNEPNIEFILLNLDQDRNKALDFLAKKEMDLPVFFKSSPLPVELDVRSIPTTFVIGPNGKIIFKHSGIASYNNPEFKSFLKTSSEIKNS